MRPSARSQISEIVRAWAEVERSTGPADRPAAEAGMLSLYRASGWRPPREIRWFDSPFGAVEAIVASQCGPAGVLVSNEIYRDGGRAPDWSPAEGEGALPEV